MKMPRFEGDLPTIGDVMDVNARIKYQSEEWQAFVICTVAGWIMADS
jgi:hypothetical protein